MTTRPNRPSEWLMLDDHQRRIRALEAVPPGEGGGTVFCVGCYEVDPVYADCVDLFPGTFVEPTETVYPDNVPGTFAVTDAVIPVGPYLCNYLAGFRLQGRFQGYYSGIQQRLYISAVHDPDVPPTTLAWEDMLGQILPPDLSDTYIDTGWITFLGDPTGAGSNSDDWTLYLGSSNGSVLFSGVIAPSSSDPSKFLMRYVSSEDAANATPAPIEEGEILVAGGSPLQWTRLAPGTVGQVLTIGAGGSPEWA